MTTTRNVSLPDELAARLDIVPNVSAVFVRCLEAEVERLEAEASTEFVEHRIELDDVIVVFKGVWKCQNTYSDDLYLHEDGSVVRIAEPDIYEKFPVEDLDGADGNDDEVLSAFGRKRIVRL